MSLDFALKDFYRKKSQTYPYVLIITLVVGLSEFFIYFSTSLGLNLIVQNSIFAPESYDNEYYFTGAINLIYSKFNTFIMVLMLILTVVVVVIITTTLILTKKKDIAIMKALGTLPERLYGYYILEAYVIFFIGFVLGLIFGLISFGIFALTMSILGFTIQFQFDFFYTPIIFFACFFGIYFITGHFLRRIGTENIIKTLSKDIPYDYDASKGFTLVPRWLSSIGHNFKMAIVNTMRRRGEFKRFMVVFTIILMIIFTLGLGVLVINNSSQKWIQKSQGENIIAIGHEDVLGNYTLMSEMFSNPKISLSNEDINFTRPEYVFNSSLINELENVSTIEKVDKRLIKFCDVKEVRGIHYNLNDTTAGYTLVGQERTGNYPIIGLKSEEMIGNHEIIGDFFTDGDGHKNMVVGDGLAYNFFDYALDQSLSLVNYGHKFHVKGVIIDSFFSGYAGYVDRDVFQEELNMTGKINLVLLELNSAPKISVEKEIEAIIKNNLGEDFSLLKLDVVFEKNIEYLSNLSYYFFLIILVMSVIAILSLYNYQKAGLMEKAKDFMIMRAIGSKKKSIKRVLFLESLFVIIPSLALSIGLGLIFNALFLLDRAYLPDLSTPLVLTLILLMVLLIFNYLSLFPIMKKIDKFTIKDFEIYG